MNLRKIWENRWQRGKGNGRRRTIGKGRGKASNDNNKGTNDNTNDDLDNGKYNDNKYEDNNNSNNNNDDNGSDIIIIINIIALTTGIHKTKESKHHFVVTLMKKNCACSPYRLFTIRNFTFSRSIPK